MRPQGQQPPQKISKKSEKTLDKPRKLWYNDYSKKKKTDWEPNPPNGERLCIL